MSTPPMRFLAGPPPTIMASPRNQPMATIASATSARFDLGSILAISLAAVG
jgi:hypothetical protein